MKKVSDSALLFSKYLVSIMSAPFFTNLASLFYSAPEMIVGTTCESEKGKW